MATGQGFQADVHFSELGNGGDVATWTFNVTPGVYRVSATWSDHPNRATDAPFMVLDGNSTLATVVIDQEFAPDVLFDQDVWWEDLGGPYTITSNTLVVRLTDDANEWVIADAVRIEGNGTQLQSTTVTGPEIDVFDGATNIIDGGTVNFGTTAPNAAVVKKLTVRNVGGSNLFLTPLSAASLPAAYSLVSNLRTTVLGPGESTKFVIRLQSTTAGRFSGPISIINTDADENPFDLFLKGTVTRVQTGSANQFEPNDSFAQATNLGTGDQIHVGMSIDLDDDDYFPWKATQTGNLTPPEIDSR